MFNANKTIPGIGGLSPLIAKLRDHSTKLESEVVGLKSMADKGLIGGNNYIGRDLKILQAYRNDCVVGLKKLLAKQEVAPKFFYLAAQERNIDLNG